MAKKNKVLNEPDSGIMIHWAIISHLKPHLLAHKINAQCHWNLSRLRNLTNSTNPESPGFSLYAYAPPTLGCEFFMMALKSENELLVKGLKNFDFLIQVRLNDADTKWEPGELLQQLNAIEGVMGVFEFDTNKIKNANALFFDVQLDHLQLIEEKEVTRTKKVN